MKLKCIDGNGSGNALTVGKVYDADKDPKSPTLFVLRDDNGNQTSWAARRFIEVASTIKVKCINDNGVAPGIIHGGIYDAELEPRTNSYKIVMNGIDTFWSAHRFAVVHVVKIKCIDADKGLSSNGVQTFTLVQGAVYDAIEASNAIGGVAGYDIITDLSPNWRPYFRKNRFELVGSEPDTMPSIQAAKSVDVDVEEQRLVAILMRPVADRFTCQRCGCPTPCAYHPLPATCKQ